jgi:hypothetical protein
MSRYMTVIDSDKHTTNSRQRPITKFLEGIKSPLGAGNVGIWSTFLGIIHAAAKYESKLNS